ncbi:MAG: hypothetical protein VX951_13085 [Planctomycetota bacterium]|nr:hypothetical protein [Planctomycetota bacterium]
MRNETRVESQGPARTTVCAGLFLLLSLQSGAERSIAQPSDVARLKKCNLVFVGEVIRLGPAPTFRTGRGGWARQQVGYKVRSVLQGNLGDKELTVHHGLLRGPTMDFANNRLSVELFKPGRQLLIGVSLAVAPELEFPGYYKLVDDSERACVVEKGLVRFDKTKAYPLAALRRALRGEKPK